jgi:hypothetical protein
LEESVLVGETREIDPFGRQAGGLRRLDEPGDGSSDGLRRRDEHARTVPKHSCKGFSVGDKPWLHGEGSYPGTAKLDVEQFCELIDPGFTGRIGETPAVLMDRPGGSRNTTAEPMFTMTPPPLETIIGITRWLRRAGATTSASKLRTNSSSAISMKSCRPPGPW